MQPNRQAWIFIVGFAIATQLTMLSCSREFTAMELTDVEYRLIVAVNEYREEHGKGPLIVSPLLQKIARYCAPAGSHVVDGLWMHERVRQEGFEGHATDNVAIGHESPEDAVKSWGTKENSVGHDLQMLGFSKLNGEWIDREYNRIGASASGKKYLAIFGRRDA